MNTDKIRNFCIIAHIDHGKSTLADRMMELTGTVEQRAMKQQLLDSMELEREKGITIKLAPVQMHYKGYELNLIDTPGHVDFSYEVSRSLQAVETAILVVDATQGIQAQTLANVYLALEQNLTIIPVINKIDLPAAETEQVASQIINLLGCDRSDIIEVSGKTGYNVEKVLDRVIEKGPSADAKCATEHKDLAFTPWDVGAKRRAAWSVSGEEWFLKCLPSGSHIARLIARIDEEAHRFAITYHTLLKRKNMLK